MSDYGDFCRESRARRQRARLAMITCDYCGLEDGKKVWRGEECDRCGKITGKQQTKEAQGE